MFRFDKSKCLGNIYHLAKERGLKIGDLEDKAGVSIGYLSRLNKEDNKSTPSIEFLLAVAQVLNVSLEGLLMCDYSELSPDERDNMDFLTKLLADTRARKIRWLKETHSELYRLMKSVSFPLGQSDGKLYAFHPLMELFDDESEARFVSKFHPDWSAWITESFMTPIGVGVDVYLVAANFIAFQGEKVTGYELYVQVRGTVIPVCYTVENEETPFYPLLNSLITSAKYDNEVLDDVAEQLTKLLLELRNEKNSFMDMGIDFEEKAFYDILSSVAKKYEFEFPEDKMIELSKRIKIILDDEAWYTDWETREDIKAHLQHDLFILHDKLDYPPLTIDDVYKEVLEQAENFKKYSK